MRVREILWGMDFAVMGIWIHARIRNPVSATTGAYATTSGACAAPSPRAMLYVLAPQRVGPLSKEFAMPNTTPAPATTTYRANPAWHAAHAAAVGANRGNAAARATTGVLTHLAWRAPAGAVAWHKGTNAAMLAHAATLGVVVGMPVHKAVALCVAALPAGATTTALHKATTALAPAK